MRCDWFTLVEGNWQGCKRSQHPFFLFFLWNPLRPCASPYVIDPIEYPWPWIRYVLLSSAKLTIFVGSPPPPSLSLKDSILKKAFDHTIYPRQYRNCVTRDKLLDYTLHWYSQIPSLFLYLVEKNDNLTVPVQKWASERRNWIIIYHLE